jgi:hypothetical protein
MRLRHLVLGVVTTMTASLAAVAAPAHASSSLSWKVVPPAVTSTQVYSWFSAVTAPAATDIWAVGRIGSGTTAPLVAHSTGSSWKVVTAPDFGASGGELNAVRAISSTDIWAVGDASGAEFPTPQAAHYDGHHWKVVPMAPNPPGAQPGGVLYGLAAVSSTNVWAVGGRPSPSDSDTLIEHWDGSHWNYVPSPTSVLGRGLSGISAASATDIWAVGSGGIDRPLAMHWNGSVWSEVALPLPAGADRDGRDYSLRAVKVISSHDVWAGGESGLIEHYDGHLWKVVPNPALSDTTQSWQLTSLTFRSSTDVWAVGGPGTLHWDGKVWHRHDLPSSLGPVLLMGVSSRGDGGTTAVGLYNFNKPAPQTTQPVMVHNLG